MTQASMKPRIVWLVAFALAALVAYAGRGSANEPDADFPAQTVRIVVPVSAGSNSDIMARVIADTLGKTWKQNVIVENRPGLPGIASVAQSAPDGYTLLINSNGHTIAAVVNTNLQFDPVRDFAAVARLAIVPFLMITPPALPVRSLAEFISYARTRPGELNFSSAGVATASFLGAEIFRQSADLRLQHVPYRGAPEAINAVIRGDAQMYFGATIPQAKELGNADRVRVLAVSAEHRIPAFPEIPAVAEAGLPYGYEPWFGMFAPAGTPVGRLEKISRGVRTALEDPDVIRALEAQGFVAAPTTPEEFRTMTESDARRFALVLKNAGLRAP